MLRPSGVSFTWLAYFSVASLYAFGHSMRLVSPMVMGQPCLMHHSIPGEIRSFTLSMFCSVILSPGATSARTAVGRIASMNVAALASTSHKPGLFDMVASPWLSVRVGGSKPPGSYTAYCPNVNLGGVARPSRHDRPPGVGASPRLTVFAARVAEAEPHERPLAALRGGRLAPDTLRRKGASAQRPRAGQPPG